MPRNVVSSWAPSRAALPRVAKPFAGKVKSKSSALPGSQPGGGQDLGEAFVVLVVVELRPCQLASLGGVEDLGGQCLLGELDAEQLTGEGQRDHGDVGGADPCRRRRRRLRREETPTEREGRAAFRRSSQQLGSSQTCHHAPFGQPRQCLDIRPAMVTECSGSTAQTDRGRNAGPQSALLPLWVKRLPRTRSSATGWALALPQGRVRLEVASSWTQPGTISAIAESPVGGIAEESAAARRTFPACGTRCSTSAFPRRRRSSGRSSSTSSSSSRCASWASASWGRRTRSTSSCSC